MPHSDDAQPVEFPVDFHEWQAGLPAWERLLVAGFRWDMRLAGQLTEKRYRHEWSDDYETFKARPVRGAR